MTIGLACFRNPRCLRRLALAAAVIYGWQYLPALWIWWSPPFVGHSIEVTVEDGRPVRVTERRDLVREAILRWRVHVINEETKTAVCLQPPTGPREQPYRPTGEQASLFADMRWEQYVADFDQACLGDMLARPGTYSLATLRDAWVWWRWVALPPVTTLRPFMVGEGLA